MLDCIWNVMAHAQKPDFVFGRNGRIHLNRRGRQFSRLLAAEVCASTVVMLDTPFSEVVWRVLATHSISQFSLHFLSLASPCAITFKLDYTFRIGIADQNCAEAAGLMFTQVSAIHHSVVQRQSRLGETRWFVLQNQKQGPCLFSVASIVFGNP
jgi:hypothetical protein